MELRIASLARRQHGVVSAAQCLAEGMSREQIKGWAAILATGPNSAIAYRSATSVHRIQPHHRGPVHVVCATRRRSRKGIVVHETSDLQVTFVNGLPVTTVERTIDDLARVASLWRSARLVGEIDDWETHHDPGSFLDDRRRDRTITIAGLRPFRLAYEDLTTDWPRTERELRQLGVPPAVPLR